MQGNTTKINTHFNALKRSGLHLLSLVLPPTCIACETLLAPTEGLGMCSECWQKMPRWDKSIQPEPELPPFVNSFNAPFLYEDTMQQLITIFKFHDTPEYADAFARFVLHYLPHNLPENTLVIPVPIHRWRLWERGFNQSDLLAEKIAKYKQIPFSRTALLRIKHTPKQTGKSKQDRQKILRAAFQADEAQVKGKHIVLVDDVWTTGSTAHVCAKTLKKAGAEEVHVATLCYTPI
jgi:ComF family protein